MRPQRSILSNDKNIFFFKLQGAFLLSINNVYINRLAIEGYTKTLFSISATLRCRGGCNSFPCIAPITLDTYDLMLSFKQGLDLGLNPGLPEQQRTI